MRSFQQYIIFALVVALLLGSCAGSKKTATNDKKKSDGTVTAREETDKLAVEQLYIDATKAKMLDDVQSATDQYKQVLKLDPQNDAAQYELALIYFTAGKNEVAREFIDPATVNDSINFVRNYVNNNLKGKKESSAAMKSLIVKGQSEYKPNKWYLVLQADVHTALADYDKAVKLYQKLLTTYPEEIDYYFDWAYALVKTNKYQEAMNIYNKLEELVGIDESISVQKDRLYLQMGRFDSAVAELQRLIDSDTDNPRYYQLLADLYQANDKTDDAVRVFDQLLKISPGNPYALLSLAEIYRTKGDHLKYLDYMKQAMANPDLGVESKIRVLFPYVGSIVKDSTKKDEALMLAKIMVDTHPEEAKAHAMYADLLMQAKELDEALHQYRLSLQNDSSIFEVWGQIFFIEAEQKKYNDLAKETERALELFPNQPLIYFFNGLAYNQLKDYTKAIASLNTASNMAVDNVNLKVQIYSTMGDAYNSMGNFTASDSAFDNALLADKNNTYVLNNYSYYLSVRNVKLDKAKEMSLRSLEQEPDNASFQDTYAWILYKLGEYADARKWEEKAIATMGEADATVLEHYGDILYKLGDTAKALEYWQKAAKLGSDSKLLEKKIADKKLYE